MSPFEGKYILLPAIFLLLVVLAAIVAVLAKLAKTARRRRALSEWAFSHGLKFRPAHDFSFGIRHLHFACLNEGVSRYAYNVMEGCSGDYRICAFDYRGFLGGEQKGDFSAVIVTTSLPMKPLVIRQKDDLDRFAAAIGSEGVQFESAAFSQEFRVVSSDRRWAFDVLPQATLEFLMSSPRFILEFQSCQIIAYRATLFQPADFDSAVGVIEEILRRLPTSLVQELQQQSIG